MILTPEEAFFLTHQGDFHTKRKVSVSQVANTKKETVFKWLKDDALYETETSPDLERGTCELLIPKVRHAMPRHAHDPGPDPVGAHRACQACVLSPLAPRISAVCKEDVLARITSHTVTLILPIHGCPSFVAVQEGPWRVQGHLERRQRSRCVCP